MYVRVKYLHLMKKNKKQHPKKKLSSAAFYHYTSYYKTATLTFRPKQLKSLNKVES